MEVLDAVLAFALGALLAQLLWRGYRDGKVKTTVLWGWYFDRRSNRVFYWMFMGLHAVGVLVCVWGVAYILFDLLRTPG